MAQTRIHSLSISDAVRIALENYPAIGIADQEVVRSKSALVEARSDLFPRLNLNLDSQYIKETGRSIFRNAFEDVYILGFKIDVPRLWDEIPDYKTELSLQVVKKVFTGGYVSESIKRAKANIDLAVIKKEIEQRAVILSTIRAYWELKRAIEVIEIEKEKVKHSESILEVVQKKYEKGVISELNREKAKVDLINNQQDLLEAETRRKIAEDKLLKEMGIINLKKKYTLKLQDDPVYDFSKPNEKMIQETIKHALSLRPEVKQIRALIRVNEADIKRAKANYYPQLNLSGQYFWAGYSNDNLFDSWLEMDNRDYWSVFFQANFNLFEGFATRSKVNQARAKLSTSRLENQNQQQIIIQQVKEAYNGLIGLAERVNILKENIALAERNLDVAKKQFELGIITIDQVSEYNLSLADIRKRYINAFIDFEIKKVELKWATGKELLQKDLYCS